MATQRFEYPEGEHAKIIKALMAGQECAIACGRNPFMMREEWAIIRQNLALIEEALALMGGAPEEKYPYVKIPAPG